MCRRDDGHIVQKWNTHTHQFVPLHNGYVVPFNPWLSTFTNCHINVEIRLSVQAIKYLYLYIYKGHDRAVADIIFNQAQPNEIKQYVDGR